MNFELSVEQKMVQKAAREFASKKIAPVVAEDDKNHRFQREAGSNRRQSCDSLPDV